MKAPPTAAEADQDEDSSVFEPSQSILASQKKIVEQTDESDDVDEPTEDDGQSNILHSPVANTGGRPPFTPPSQTPPTYLPNPTHDPSATAAAGSHGGNGVSDLASARDPAPDGGSGTAAGGSGTAAGGIGDATGGSGAAAGGSVAAVHRRSSAAAVEEPLEQANAISSSHIEDEIKTCQRRVASAIKALEDLKNVS